jgi:ribulose-5-phosphate 4-epimerase/fuculose-1-phosphate aldolase
MDPWDSIVAAGARLAAHGLIVGAEGNLSIRLDDGSLLLTPTGRRKDELQREDLVVIPLVPHGAPPPPEAPRPSSDVAIHRAIYAARPRIRAIAHAHLPAAMALTLAGETPDPAVLPETALLLPRLPVVPYGRMGSAELAARIAAAVTAGPEPMPDAVILERHGAIAIGEDLEAAVDRLDLVDVLCRTWRDARLMAPERRLTPPADPAATG